VLTVSFAFPFGLKSALAAAAAAPPDEAEEPRDQ
jgi:hypothetical protein